MVKLEEVEDEAFLADQLGAQEEENEWENTDDESDTSSLASSIDEQETLYDRLAALQDIVPPSQRRALSSASSTATEWGKWGFNLTMKGVWVLSASLLLLGVPFALASTEDQQIAMEEKQMQLQASANELMAPGATSGPTQHAL